MNLQIEESWKQILAPEFEKDYFIRLTASSGKNTTTQPFIRRAS